MADKKIESFYWSGIVDAHKKLAKIGGTLNDELESAIDDLGNAIENAEDYDDCESRAIDEAIQEFKDDKLDLDAAALDRLAELLRENPERDPAACKNLSDLIWKEVGIA